ncbi:MAG: helix-turn-helix transcriptional regulator [Patescibacteria group bacterium]|nr:helix-turn-helix transcriptional regulator [Patescibacteria group bacterium]
MARKEMRPTEPFGKLLYRARRRKHLTQAALGEKIFENLPRRACQVRVSAWEKGTQLPVARLLPAIAKATGKEISLVAAAFYASRIIHAMKRAQKDVGHWLK